MSVIKANGAGSAGGDFYAYKINQSLRFNDGDSAYLTRDPSSAGNRQKFTYSVWFKRSVLSAAEQDLFSAGDSSTDRFEFILSAAYPNQLQIYMNTSGTIGSIITSQVFRDVSAWYHLVVAFDTTQGTAANRVKIYVNGSQITNFHTETYPSQNFNTAVNSTSNQYISKRNYVNDRYYNGYMAEINMIDGQQLTPASFGETKDGVWVPKDASGLTFGTNGFYLPFDDSSAIGDDESSNTNDFTVSGLVATDVVPDSPTNNFATWNYLSSTNLTYTVTQDGNLKANMGSGTGTGLTGTFSCKGGKWYWENRASNVGNALSLGITTGSGTFSNMNTNGIFYDIYGNKRVFGTTTGSAGATFAANDIIGMAVDAESAGTIAFYKNNALQFTVTESSILTDDFLPWILNNSSSAGSLSYVNFGQDSTFSGAITAGGNSDGNGVGDFKYAPPSGYLALCTANLPDPTIGPTASTLATDNFNTVLYTGDGGTNRAVTGVGFAPDWVWVKNRDESDRYHLFTDTVRGATKSLASSLTNAEADTTYANGLKSFDSDGFTVGNLIDFNGSSDKIVAWNWKAATAFSGTTNRSKAYSGRSNSAAGFSIITYVGDEQVGHEIPHNLDAAPEFVIAKSRGHADHWDCYHVGIASDAETDYIRLNSTGAAADAASVWNDTAPSSTVVTLGNTDDVNKNNIDHIMYAFHSVEGYCKVSSYTGNGNANGPFVFTGFRPAWVLIKSSTNGYDWVMDDTARSPFNEMNNTLYPNDEYAEYTGGAYGIDYLSNGFKPRTAYGQYNLNGANYIYLAFAEAPFKFANAR